MKAKKEIEQQISQQIQAYEHLNMIVDAHFKKHFVDVFTMSNNEGKYILTRDELIEILSVLLKC